MKRYDQNDIEQLDDALTYDDFNFVPDASAIQSRRDVSTTSRLVGDIHLRNPIIPANMDTITELDMMIAAASAGSIAFHHRFADVPEVTWNLHGFYDAFQDYNYDDGRPPCGVSIGTGQEEINRANAYIEVFRQRGLHDRDRMVILIDVAHGHHSAVVSMIKTVRDLIREARLGHKIFIIAGNVATREAASTLFQAGAHGVKCGVGNGSLCETRLRTGCGVPQASAVAEVAKGLNDFLMRLTGYTSWQPTVIADGGVKYPGDVLKALWLGASAVMSGYLFAGTNETPGIVMKKGLFPNETEVKIYRGSASHASKIDRGEDRNIEGNVKEIPVKGSVKYVFDQVQDGLRSGISYVGSVDIYNFREQARVVRITPSGIIEARPNLLEK